MSAVNTEDNHSLNDESLTPPVLIQVFKDSDENAILTELRVDTVKMFQAIPYLMENRVINNSGKTDKNANNSEVELIKVSEVIVRPFTLAVVESIIISTKGHIPQAAKVSSNQIENSVSKVMQTILSKFNVSELQRIYKTACFFSMTTLKQNVAAMIATMVYVGTKESDFEAKQKELRVEKKFSYETMLEFREEMPELEFILQ